MRSMALRTAASSIWSPCRSPVRIWMERAGKRVPLMLSFSIATISREGGAGCVNPDVCPKDDCPNIVPANRAIGSKRIDQSQRQHGNTGAGDENRTRNQQLGRL